jgi:predicted HTH domain antitoxin
VQIAFELPNDFVALQSPAQVQQEAQASYALWLYQQGRVTLAKAAELAGMNLYDFMGLCKSSRVPVIDISREELLQELAGLNPA